MSQTGIRFTLGSHNPLHRHQEPFSPLIHQQRNQYAPFTHHLNHQSMRPSQQLDPRFQRGPAHRQLKGQGSY